MRKMRIGAINIVMPEPHSPERYIDLLKLAARRKIRIPLRGDEVGILASARRHNDNVVTGELYRYLDLEEARDWFNTQTGAQAEEDDLRGIVIPEHLKPHFKSFPYLFDARRHRLVFVSRDQKETLSSPQAAKLLDKTFGDGLLQSRFGDVRAFVEPAREQVEQILRIRRLTKLEIVFETQPNPDFEDEEFEAEVKSRLDAEHAKSLRQEMTAKEGMGLAPSPETQQLARVAASNGFVAGSGFDRNNRKVEMSTQDVPWYGSVDYEPQRETRIDVLTRVAGDFIRALRR